MPNPSIPSALLLLLAAPAVAQDSRVPRVTQLTIRQRIIIRIPALPARRVSGEVAPAEIRYAEKKGPKCIASRMLASSAITRPDSIDLVLSDGSRVRAKLGKHCPALDFYSGFYLKPDRDGAICSDRDSVRSRAGDECQIDAFKKLVAKR
jgi:hypothetical protein